MACKRTGKTERKFRIKTSRNGCKEYLSCRPYNE